MKKREKKLSPLRDCGNNIQTDTSKVLTLLNNLPFKLHLILNPKPDLGNA